jgi:parallel beta-helix repeat protein
MKNYKIITISSIILFLIIVVIPTVLSDENSKTIYVDDDGTADYISIQDAIDNASDGDTIFVYNGTYYEHITIDKPITLIGEDKNFTIIESDWISSSVYVSANNVTISGFTIQNGLIGIHLSSCHNTTITNNIISNNADLNKYVDLTGIKLKLPIWPTIAGVYLRESNGNWINKNIIIDNVGSGIVLCLNSGINYISENIITNNSNGVYLYSSCSNTVTNNNISINMYHGIIIKYDSENNSFFINNLFANTENTYDECNNTWYNSNLELGNYYDDYNGTDKNNDGIGDTPYNIPGEKCQDLYPLMSPYYGRIVINNFYVDQDAVLYMLWIAMIATILFLIPIAYIWYRKTRPRE